MNQKRFGWILGVVIGLGLIFGFQNCGNGFSALDGAGNLSSSSSSGGGVNTLAIAPMAVTAALYTVEDLTFKLSGALANSASTIKWSNIFSGTTPCTQDVNEADPTQYGLNCSVPGTLVVNVSAIDDSGVLNSRSFTGQVLANPNPSPSGGEAATFAITAGTGGKSWNAATAPIELYIGMTLTIKNADTISHQLHVDRYDANPAMNGHPCAHEVDPMAPGGSYDCVVTKAYNPATDPVIYDHNAGPTARFYLVAYDGAALYSTNCASCHGPIKTSNVSVGITCPGITSAITSVAKMKNVVSLASLTLVQKKAIAFALKNR